MTDPREAAREAVRAAFEKGPAGPEVRRCPSCGQEAATVRLYCPHCGKRYDRRLPWLGDTARRALLVAGAIGGGIAAALILPGVFEAKDERDARKAAEHRARVATEVKRLTRQQRPMRGGAPDLKGPAVADRERLIGALEADILADARARITAGELDGPVLRVDCGPLVRARETVKPDHEDLEKKIGRYDCVAVKADVIKEDEVVAALGHPFIAAVEFRRFTYVWCKDNKQPGERGKALAVVPLDPVCLAAEGAERVGSGYVAPEE